MSVDRRVGLMAFGQAENMATIMSNMHWSLKSAMTNNSLLATIYYNGGPGTLKQSLRIWIGTSTAVILPIDPKTCSDWVTGLTGKGIG
jgi:hypothetical protein